MSFWTPRLRSPGRSRAQSTEAATQLALRKGEVALFAPAIFDYEVRNALLAAERPKRLPRADAERELALILSAVTITGALDDAGLEHVLVLARAEALSFYDACYLDLALRLGAELATRDSALLSAGGRRGAQHYDAR